MKRRVVPDLVDLRDRPYMPSVSKAPPARMRPRRKLPILDQDDTNACTGFALASTVSFLIAASGGGAPTKVSPYMLYSMARRYDEFPGTKEDGGSSLRGAMKGWYKHGACKDALWRGLEMPPPVTSADKDWWQDAVRRPLGAYYRVDTRSVTDMHVALDQVGVLYASAICHDGWLEGSDAEPKQGSYWRIPNRGAAPSDGGHAFVIVGYESDGFVIQNSWGPGWGSKGLAVLSYEDWTRNAMDCWVAQMGVVTDQHLEIAGASSLRVSAGRVQIAGEPVLRNRELAPFVIDMENNGCLSSSGSFRTQPSDVNALVDHHLKQARQRWGLREGEPTDVAIYAHGGLTGEDGAAETAAKWVPALYDAHVLPVFLMWETDLWSTLKNRFADLISGEPRPTAGVGAMLKHFWNERIERLLAGPGWLIWDEMKQNAKALSFAPESGGRMLYEAAQQSQWIGPKHPVRLHLIGHSAGAIVHSHLVQQLGDLGWKFASVNFMAPAVTADLFSETVLKRLKDGTIERLRSFHLSDAVELQDPTCRPILGYSRSLLYLVSESFEGAVHTPILGMQKYFDEQIGSQRLPNVEAFTAPSERTRSSTHGGFDDDDATMKTIVSAIRRA